MSRFNYKLSVSYKEKKIKIKDQNDQEWSTPFQEILDEEKYKLYSFDLDGCSWLMFDFKSGHEQVFRCKVRELEKRYPESVTSFESTKRSQSIIKKSHRIVLSVMRYEDAISAYKDETFKMLSIMCSLFGNLKQVHDFNRCLNKINFKTVFIAGTEVLPEVSFGNDANLIDKEAEVKSYTGENIDLRGEAPGQLKRLLMMYYRELYQIKGMEFLFQPSLVALPDSLKKIEDKYLMTPKEKEKYRGLPPEGLFCKGKATPERDLFLVCYQVLGLLQKHQIRLPYEIEKHLRQGIAYESSDRVTLDELLRCLEWERDLRHPLDYQQRLEQLNP